jgi:WD40 repeat protein
MFSSVTCSPDSKNIYAASSDGTIKELNAEGLFVRDLPFKTQVNNVLLARTGRYFFASTSLFDINLSERYRSLASAKVPTSPRNPRIQW